MTTNIDEDILDFQNTIESICAGANWKTTEGIGELNFYVKWHRLLKQFISLTGLLDEIANDPNFILPPLTREEYKNSERKATKCSNCHVEYCPLVYSPYPEDPRLSDLKDIGPHCWVHDRYDEYYLQCCSEECVTCMRRRMRLTKKRRELEWQAIKISKELLKEARRWTKLHIASA